MKREIKLRFRDVVYYAFFPRRCLFCKEVIYPDTQICIKCEEKITIIDRKVDDKPYHEYDGCYALYRYSGRAKHMLWEFKFKDNPKVGRELSLVFAERLERLNRKYKFDLIVSVPMSSKSKKERGYNQSDIICEVVSGRIGVKFDRRVMKKSDNVGVQREQKREYRRDNVRGAYHVRDGIDISGKRILLVDDVATTGSTLSECAMKLKGGGAEFVYCASILSV